MRHIKLFREIFESDDNQKGGVAFIKLEYNYPDDEYDEEEDNRSFDTGEFGEFYIDLSDPTKYFVTDKGENGDVSHYIDEGIIEKLKEYGSAPYSVEDIESLGDALNDLYQEDCRTAEAYVDVTVTRTGIDPKEFSKFIEAEEIEDIPREIGSLILKIMDLDNQSTGNVIPSLWDKVPEEHKAYLAKYHPNLSPEEKREYAALDRHKKRII